MASTSPIRVAILWHMHQPNYQAPGNNRLVMPWVRFHALKDYLDMPLLVAKHDKVKVTFNLVPSLIDQIEHYVAGGTDSHFELSRATPESMTSEQKRELVKTFFDANLANMIEPYPRYHSLYQKAQRIAGDDSKLERTFSPDDIRDLQVWSNLVWIDPMFRDEEPVADLLLKQRDYSEEEKQGLLDWQIDLLGRIMPTYRKLLEEGKIDISFTPYYHPILPLLCDTDSALEALPDLSLPSRRFSHPEDAEAQIVLAMEKYEQLFGRKMTGMWPSEGSISEEVLRMVAKKGIEWVASDEELLWHSALKSGQSPEDTSVHTMHQFGDGARLFFRDHSLSDKIGFVYSTWPADRAVDDFICHIKKIRLARMADLESTVVPVILDGENVWEYFPNDGNDFLALLYERLAGDDEIELITMSDAARLIPPRPLPRVMAGSWINHNFRIWIGHDEDNTAWEMLHTTRDALVEFEKAHPDFDRERLSNAWRQIYMAEGSDWCWWYGDEHRGSHNSDFDRMFRRHLMAVYESLELEIPARLEKSIYHSPSKQISRAPEGLLTPVIDGRQTHFYEWAGGGYFDFEAMGGSMHRVDQSLAGLHYCFDRQRLYIRLDFMSKNHLDLLRESRLSLELATPDSGSRVIELGALKDGSRGGEPGGFVYAVGEIVEVAIDRAYIWSKSYGEIALKVSLHEGSELVERWPEGEQLTIDVPEQSKELFWPA